MRYFFYHTEIPAEEKNLRFYFIPSSEFNAYLQQIQVILSAVENIIFFTSDEYDLYFFTVANRAVSTI